MVMQMMKPIASATLPPEQAAIRDRCVHPNGRFVAFDRHQIEQSITDRFEDQVRRFPQNLAIKFGDEELTYHELNVRSNRIAHSVLDRLDEGQQGVGLLLGHDTSSIIALLGVLKAGKMYVPLEPSHPLERLRYVVDNSQADLILADDYHMALARNLANDGVKLVNTDRLGPHVASENPGLAVRPDALAYVLYTSGSTGQPKGVTDTHRNVLHQVMLLTNDMHLCDDDRVAHMHSFSFSASVRKIFPSLLNGASIHLWNLKEQGMMDLADWMVLSGITVFGGREIMRRVSDWATAGYRFPDLRISTIGGDTIYIDDLERWRKLAPNATFVISLATTETGTITQYFIDRDSVVEGPVVPVGYPVADKQLLLLDEGNSEIGAADVGEIAARSRYLSPGYWRRPDLNRDKFLSDVDSDGARLYLTGDLGRMLPGGCLVHLGRKDFQVKVRGYSVEVSEVEGALLSSGMVKDAVVVGREDGSGDKRLVAYVVPTDGAAPLVSALRRALAETLPEYMIPAAFMCMESLPRTQTGKVDRRALPSPDRSRPVLETRYVPPRTPIEEELAGIWSSVLELDQVGVDDSFVELGGNSLLAAQIISRVINTFRVEVDLRVLLESATVAEMANLVLAKHLSSDGILSKILAELEVISDEPAGMVNPGAKGTIDRAEQ